MKKVIVVLTTSLILSLVHTSEEKHETFVMSFNMN